MLYPTKTAIGLALALCGFHRLAAAHDVITTNLTYSREVSRIFAKRCVACHSAADPIPLTTYGQIRPWAVAIKEQVLGRSMPPWGAVKGFGNLSPDEALSQEEVMTIAEWVIGGAPEGSRLLLPGLPAQTRSRAAAFVGNNIPVETQMTITKETRIVGLQPQPAPGKVSSSQIVAELPDGLTVPLVWLYNYDAKWGRSFRFRSPLNVPAGTVIRSSTPLSFTLEVAR